MDLSHGLPFARPMEIYAGGYDDIVDCGLIIITAGANQKPDETRIDLVHKNIAIFKKIIPEIKQRGCEGILLIVSNVINALFSAALIVPMYRVIVTFHASAAASPILRIPKAVSFSILPFSMVLVIIRTVQECIRLSKEEEKALGLGKPTFDVDALEREYLDRVRKEKEGAQA